MKSKKTSYCEMSVVDGVLHLVYDNLDLLNLSDARQIVKERLEFCNGVIYPHLFDISKVKKSSKEARDYMADEGNDLVSASALIVNSSVVKMLANFFITVNKPKSPTKMFTSKDEAISWLSQFKNDNSVISDSSGETI